MLLIIAQSSACAQAHPPIFKSLLASVRRTRRIAAPALLRGADGRDGGTGAPAHGRAADRGWRQRAASRLRARHHVGRTVRRRRAWGILGAFYPGPSHVPALAAAGAARRR